MRTSEEARKEFLKEISALMNKYNAEMQVNSDDIITITLNTIRDDKGEIVSDFCQFDI